MAIKDESVSALLARRLWREERRPKIDQELRSQFCRRAAQIRDEVTFLLNGGLNEGAMESLATIAEQDMLDFDILVDLAADVSIEGVAPLSLSTRQHLHEFLATEPWSSLATDHDITIALAMIETVAIDPQLRPWYEIAPDLYRVLAEVMDRVDAEQCRRVIEELQLRSQEFGFCLPKNTAEHIDQVLRSGAQRVGIKPPDSLFVGSLR